MRKISSLFLFALFAASLFAFLPTPAAAQDDPPGRVARLNYMQGSVSYQVSGDQDWVQADPNRPRLLVTESGVGYRLQARLEDIAAD